MPPRDYYGILGVPPNATPDEIKKAYRQLARELHPDVNPSADAQERFKEVTAAYEVLSDPAKRQVVDLGGDPLAPGGGGGAGVRPASAASPTSWTPSSAVPAGWVSAARARGSGRAPTRWCGIELDLSDTAFGVDPRDHARHRGPLLDVRRRGHRARHARRRPARPAAGAARCSRCSGRSSARS